MTSAASLPAPAPAPARSLRPALRALLAAAAALLLSFGAASGAWAHDSVESTEPANGSTVAVVPGQVTVTLSDTPGALGSAIKVLDASGTDWATGPVQVVDNVATQQVKAGAPSGAYTVQWRLVSSDSHPIEGSFTFTAGSPDGAAAGTAAPLVQTTEAAAPQAASSDGIPWSVIAMIAVLVALVAGLVIFAKRRLGTDD
ncbi:copper resistance CopC family protein [Arthrobacter sp. 35W]|uniref:copper resistance CopC family protein n=1 Tax=Arthrobacter sp. 35W TaxID=1132441 RepID=UPI00042539D7|nr:copper resistance CopC family protein [Arthrobacter sp. 35W]